MNTQTLLRFLAHLFRPDSQAALDFRWNRKLRDVDTLLKNRTYDQVEGALDRALDWLEETRPGHSDYTDKLCTLAGLYQSLVGDNSKAEEIFRKAIETAGDRGNQIEMQLAVPLNSLGLLLLQQRRYAEAEPLFRQLLKLVEHRLGSDHVEVATALENLAAVERHLGRTEAAAKTRDRAVQIRKAAQKRY